MKVFHLQVSAHARRPVSNSFRENVASERAAAQSRVHCIRARTRGEIDIRCKPTHQVDGVEYREVRPALRHLRPDTERTAKHHQLADVVGGVVSHQQQGAEKRLVLLAGRNLRREIGDFTREPL